MSSPRIYIGRPYEMAEAIAHVQPLHAGRAFVKPNLTFPEYRPGVTTTPALLESLLMVLKQAGLDVTVGEADGGNHSFSAHQAFNGHGLPEMCKRLGVHLVNLSEEPRSLIRGHVAGRDVGVDLPTMLLSGFDYFVSMPVLKVHAMTQVSLCLKNLWGCIPDTMRLLRHHDLPRVLALVARTLRPNLNIIDATWALDGHGPMFGEPVHLERIIVGDDVVATDIWGCESMGIDWRRLPHIMVPRAACQTKMACVTGREKWGEKRNFRLRRTPTDYLSLVAFRSRLLSRLAWASPASRAITGVASLFRTSKERQIAKEVRR